MVRSLIVACVLLSGCGILNGLGALPSDGTDDNIDGGGNDTPCGTFGCNCSGACTCDDAIGFCEGLDDEAFVSSINGASAEGQAACTPDGCTALGAGATVSSSVGGECDGVGCFCDAANCTCDGDDGCTCIDGCDTT
jgi:hypothetical protein